MPKTYNDLYLATRTALKNAGVEAYALEARLLVAYAVGKTKEEFVRDLRLYTSDENEQKIAALLQRRIAGEPLAYLIGEWEFHGLPIVVTPDVLIPRMDTEVLVDAALRVLVGRKMNARILDLCSGSGCIGCALAHELPAARVVMVDISEEALAVSKENLRRNHQNRTICLRADALEKPPMGIGTFDLIVSNPPYVASMDILTLDSSVRDYEPLGALDGGEDGLMFYRAIVRHWTQILRPGGWLMFEVGEDQADAVMALMTEEKYTDVTALEDTAGIRRKSRVDDRIEKFSVMRAKLAIERADVCLIMIDARDGVTEQDTKIAGLAHEAGKASIIVVNKWDLVEKETGTMEKMRKDVLRDLSFMSYAPVLFISALTGQRTERLFELINFVNDQSAMRITTGMLNNVLADAQARVQPPTDKGRRLKIYYMTQTGVKPPCFVVFCNSKELFHFSYQRYLENQIRAVFGLEGTPVRMVIRQKGEQE